jgi:hypothetical protein
MDMSYLCGTENGGCADRPGKLPGVPYRPLPDSTDERCKYALKTVGALEEL